MDITSYIFDAHRTAVEKGWWDKDKTFGELIALCHSELSEALEEFRNNNSPTTVYYAPGSTKPEGVPTELADVLIRIMDLCGYYGIDLEKALIEKLEYNRSRPYRHGGKIL